MNDYVPEMRWSVLVEAEGDREITLDEVVELADAVAPLSGIAAGAGTTGYSVRIVVRAWEESEAEQAARAAFAAAVSTAGLPPWPVEVIEVLSEVEDEAVGYER